MGKQAEIDELTKALRETTRAVRALTKRLNEQTIDTDAVSVISLVERAAEDDE